MRKGSHQGGWVWQLKNGASSFGYKLGHTHENVQLTLHTLFHETLDRNRFWIKGIASSENTCRDQLQCDAIWNGP